MEESIGTRLAAAMEAKGWSQGDLARESGVSQSLISMIRNGSRPNPMIKTLMALEKALGLAHGELSRPAGQRGGRRLGSAMAKGA